MTYEIIVRNDEGEIVFSAKSESFKHAEESYGAWARHNLPEEKEINF